MTVAGRLEGADPADLDGLREAISSSDRPEYVIEHLGDQATSCRGRTSAALRRRHRTRGISKA
jgi:hypothetical protein